MKALGRIHTIRERRYGAITRKELLLKPRHYRPLIIYAAPAGESSEFPAPDTTPAPAPAGRDGAGRLASYPISAEAFANAISGAKAAG